MRWLRRLLVGPKLYDELQRNAEEVISHLGIEGTDLARRLRREASDPSPFLSDYMSIDFELNVHRILSRSRSKILDAIRPRV